MCMKARFSPCTTCGRVCSWRNKKGKTSKSLGKAAGKDMFKCFTENMSLNGVEQEKKTQKVDLI